jgi:hypothetical protein
VDPEGTQLSIVIACDKREAFAQGSEATKQSILPRAVKWIASRSLSSGAHSRDPLARNDGAVRSMHKMKWPLDKLQRPFPEKIIVW